MPLLIKNGDFVTADSRFHGDLYVEDQTITRIGTGLDAPPGAEVIDATEKLVFPGFIDPHVHIYLPFMSTFAERISRRPRRENSSRSSINSFMRAASLFTVESR